MSTLLSYEILSNKYPCGIAKNEIVCYNKQ